eukprot:CAMPEP_0172380152 /NCGR_PEP_ID=MMETSP1060-20121228/70293_1 /TAXON_ID=37318 /ORGANISM="Pseudo-nitzschia pungens, Strain cf. cingulata" /LENGTH=263 /DNA_ID=CAMNT_0013107901 /DNA_START=497 /DNA_END=1287 /DNA_ORIENTATION=+
MGIFNDVASVNAFAINAYCIVSAMFFAACAYAQLNDPNPIQWFCAYVFGGCVPNLYWMTSSGSRSRSSNSNNDSTAANTNTNTDAGPGLVPVGGGTGDLVQAGDARTQDAAGRGGIPPRMDLGLFGARGGTGFHRLGPAAGARFLPECRAQAANAVTGTVPLAVTAITAKRPVPVGGVPGARLGRIAGRSRGLRLRLDRPPPRPGGQTRTQALPGRNVWPHCRRVVVVVVMVAGVGVDKDVDIDVDLDVVIDVDIDVVIDVVE